MIREHDMIFFPQVMIRAHPIYDPGRLESVGVLMETKEERTIRMRNLVVS